MNTRRRFSPYFTAIALALAALPGAASGKTVTPCPQSIAVAPGDTLTIGVCIDDPSGIDAFGLVCTFDPAVVEYDSTTAGSNTAGWTALAGNETMPGSVTLGGFDPTPIAQTTPDTLANLVFIALAAGNTTITFSGWLDDLAGQLDVSGVIGVCPPAPCPAGGPRITVADVIGTIGDTIQVNVGIQESAGPIDAFGLQLIYPKAFLSFISATACSLTAGWTVVDGSENTPGLVTLGGLDTMTEIATGSTGGIVCLTFEVLACVPGDAGNFLPINPIDDLAGTDVCCGAFTCLVPSNDGDVNEDGFVTPADALCAFEMFMNPGIVPPPTDATCTDSLAADWNCDGTVSPGDALAIFQHFLTGGTLDACCPGDPGCTKTVTGGGDESKPGLEPYRLETSTVRALHDLLAVPLDMLATEGHVAFGLELRFDAEKTEYVRLDLSSAAQGWQAVDAVEVEPGFLRLGGFDSGGLNLDAVNALEIRSGRVEIANLVFRKRTPDARLRISSVDWKEQILGDGRSIDPGEDSSVSRIHFGRPQPNPMNGEVSLSLAIPTDHERRVEVYVYDVQGRLVKTVLNGVLPPGMHRVHWDRTDRRGARVGAGIYMFQMRSKDLVLRRKVVVVD